MSSALSPSNDRDFDDKVEIYKAFHADSISREKAVEQIGDDWDAVAQVASAAIAREEQEPVTSDEITDLLG